MIIIRYDEIGTKGNNRKDFERRLCRNILSHAKRADVDARSIKMRMGRILLDADDDSFLTRIFGISSFSKAKIFDSWDSLVNAVSSVDIKESFRVSCQRIDKNFPKKSPDVEKELGTIIKEKTGKKVKLEEPETEVNVEIIDGRFYLFTDKSRGLGGLPVGCEGIVEVNCDNADLCALMLMKRGCLISSDIDLKIADEYSPAKIRRLDCEIVADDSELPKDNDRIHPLACIPRAERESLLNQFLD